MSWWQKLFRTTSSGEASKSQRQAPQLRGMTHIGENSQGLHQYKHNQTGIVLVYIDGGTFQMGSDDGNSDEKPIHEVTVSDFLIGKYAVTQGQWRKIMGNNPASFRSGDNYPVEQVSWNDCQEFCKRTGLRLPTEAEWEYAVRAKTTTQFYWGDTDKPGYYASLVNSTYPVGQMMPNGFGLYDMTGNVWEWCSDWYSDSYYGTSPKDNPPGPSSGLSRVQRGGSWTGGGSRCRSAHRDRSDPTSGIDSFGFRCAADLSGTSS